MSDRILDSRKVDQGFCVNYWRLSYRRRMIRDIWLAPFVVGVILLWIRIEHGHIRLSNAWPIGAVALIGAISILYNRRMWKLEKSINNAKRD